jgi:hypothetical protein
VAPNHPIASSLSPAESLEGCNEKGGWVSKDPTSPNAKGYFLDMAVVSDAGFSRKANSANFPLWRFEDLRAQGIVLTWTTLNKWIDERGFPPGRMIGRFRTWTAAEVLACKTDCPGPAPNSIAVFGCWWIGATDEA